MAPGWLGVGTHDSPCVLAPLAALRMAADSPLKIQAWKYAWGEHAAGPGGARRNVPAGAGAKASDRLYHAAKSGRSAREAMQREMGGGVDEAEPVHVPLTNKRSQALAANRYSKVMASKAATRYRKDVINLAKAKGTESAHEDVYNYGDMLYQEAEMTRVRRDAWRTEQLRQRATEDAKEETFRPHINQAASNSASVAGEEGEAAFLARLARRDEEQREKARMLREHVRAEESRELTFRPNALNKKSQQLTSNYTDVMSEMEAREKEAHMRLRVLRERQELAERGRIPAHPDVAKSTASHAWAMASTSKGSEPAAGEPAIGEGDASASATDVRSSLPAHKRLHETFTSSYQQSLLPPTYACRGSPNPLVGPTCTH